MNSLWLSMEFVGGISPSLLTLSLFIWIVRLFSQNWREALRKKEEEDQSSEGRDMLRHKQA